MARWFKRTALTGGTANALDGINGNTLADEDVCMTFVSNVFRPYVLDASSGATEDSPNVIAPDQNPGLKRWILFDITDVLVSESAYSSTMTGNETFAYTSGVTRKFFLDPNGADRRFNPSGAFPKGYEAVILNTGGPYNIVFNSSGASYIITPGVVGRFIYDSNDWV